MEHIWTVARFPNGSWTTGGKPHDPGYSECEVWQVMATSRAAATKIAQGKRYRERLKRASQPAPKEAP